MKDKKFKSREALIEESLKEFASTSYEKASLNRIIKNAKVSKGSFYYHFENKEDLYRQLLKEGVEAKWSFIKQYTIDHSSEFKDMDIFDKFLYQAKAGIEFANIYPKYNDLGNMFAKEKGTDIYNKLIHSLGGDSTSAMKELVATSYNDGQIDNSYSIDFVANLLEKLFTYYSDFFDHSENQEEEIAKLQEFIRFLKYGLKVNE